MKYFLIVVIASLSLKGMAQMPAALIANKTPELKPYDYSAKYDGLKGHVKEVIAFEGRINSVFGNKTLVKGMSAGSVKYLPDGLRMEAHMVDGGLEYGVRYDFNDEKPDSILIYEYFKNEEKYEDIPYAKIEFEYVSKDSIIEKYYKPSRNGGLCNWEQTEQINIKLVPGGFEGLYFPRIVDDGESFSYVSHGLKFNSKDERRDLWKNNSVLFENSIFRPAKLSLIREAVRFTNDGAGELRTDDLGRIIRMRPSQKKLDQLLSDGFNNYKATHLEYDEKGNIANIVRSEYWTKGPKQNRHWKHTADDVIKVDYTYDSYGNWTMAKITSYHQSWENKNSSLYGKETDKKGSYYIREISYYSDDDKTPPTSYFVKAERAEDDIEKTGDDIEKTGDDIEKTDDGIGQPIYENVQHSPEYPGGKNKLVHDIINSLPEKYRDKCDGDGKHPAKITFKFAVYKSGKTDSIEIIKGGENLSESESDEIIGAFRQLDDFSPGKSGRHTVNSWVTLPVELYLSFSQLNGEAQRDVKARQEKEAQEEAKRLCTLAYDACEYGTRAKEYDKLSKAAGAAAIPGMMGATKGLDPAFSKNIKIEQLKSYKINGDSYTFLRKDKTAAEDVHFDRKVSDLDYSYHNFGFLSDDKKYALIIYRNYHTEDYIYFVEFEGDDIKSINYIPYNKSHDFVMPQL